MLSSESSNLCVYLKVTLVHGSPHGTTRAPFHASRLGLPSELAHCIIPGWGQLVNVVLLSLMRHVWIYVVLPFSRIDSSAPLVGRPDRV